MEDQTPILQILHVRERDARVLQKPLSVSEPHINAMDPCTYIDHPIKRARQLDRNYGSKSFDYVAFSHFNP